MVVVEQSKKYKVLGKANRHIKLFISRVYHVNKNLFCTFLCNWTLSHMDFSPAFSSVVVPVEANLSSNAV